MHLHLLLLFILFVVPQGQVKRFQCRVDTDGESIKLVQCQHEDQEDMVEGGFNFLNFPDKWKPALSRAHPGEGTAHFEEFSNKVCLRQVRPLDGFVRHPAQENLNLCQTKGKGWKRLPRKQ